MGIMVYGSAREKAAANIQIIKLIKQLKEEGRPATFDEQELIARYSGFGSNDVMDEAEELGLEALLSEAEYESLLGSTLNAHYTDARVARAIWEVLIHLGLDGDIRVLDPSAGAGVFRQMSPSSLSRARWMQIEKDIVTGDVLSYLYPDEKDRSKVYVTGFENIDIPDGYFDLVISNVPFGDYPVIDRSIKINALKSAIHDYFFVKALKAVRPGGVIAFITSRYTLDKLDQMVREHIATHADLLAAVRLPKGAFRRSAGTEVITDVIFLRRRWKTLDETDVFPSWVETKEVDLPHDMGGEWAEDISSWFVENPNLVIGDMTVGRGQYRNNSLVVRYEGDDVAEQLGGRLKAFLPEDLLREKQLPTEEEGRGLDFEEPPVNVTHVIPNPGGNVQGQIEALRKIYDLAKQLLKAEIDSRTEDVVAGLRQQLNLAYDSYKAFYGLLNEKKTVQLLEKLKTPALPFLKALETLNEKSGRWVRADLFYKETLRTGYAAMKVEGVFDAYRKCLGEIGRVDLEYIADLVELTEVEVIAQLGDLIYFDPDQDKWVQANMYLSGNIRSKLQKAKAYAQLDSTYDRNVEALTKALPKSLNHTQIKARLGAGWIPADVVESFITHLLPGADRAGIKVKHLATLGSWTLSVERVWALPAFELNTKYGTKRASAIDLLKDCLDNRIPLIYDEDDKGGRVLNKVETLNAQAKLAEIRAAFETWIWDDPERAKRLEDKYNAEINVYRRPSFDGSHLVLPGLNAEVPVSAYQKDMVWRTTQSQTAGLFHDVGLGKTRMSVVSAVEAIRLGLAKKALFVVPNHVVGQWQEEFTRAYPLIEVLCATPKDLSKKLRPEFMSRIATGRHQIVIVPMSSFRLLPLDPGTEAELTSKKLSELREFLEELKAEDAPRRAQKDIQKAILRFEARLDELNNMRKDNDKTITFDELGIDILVTDEFHLLKNLYFSSKMTGVAGIPRSKTQRAWDMYMKIRATLRKGGRFWGLTATPVTNSLAEVFVMQTYFQQETLDAMGLAHFDNWARLFAEEVAQLEMTADGAGFQLVTRLTKFCNLPELSEMFAQFGEVVRWKDVPHEVVKRPELYLGKPITIVAPGSDELREFIEDLADRVAKIKSGSVNPREDNMLLVTTDGRKAALHLPLVSPGSKPLPYSKVRVASDVVARIYHATTLQKATQLVFCDLSTPSAKPTMKSKRADVAIRVDIGFYEGELVSNDTGEVIELEETGEENTNEVVYLEDVAAFANLYEEMATRLVDLGVAREEIAFVHDAKNVKERNELQRKMRKGQIRILLGSTEKMGTGMNVQDKLFAIHHLDAPWRPADITQRSGRMLRQGNCYDKVLEFIYITASSPDGFVWQKLETKNAMVEAFYHGLLTSREMDDISDVTLSMAEIKAAASGNPLIIQRVALQAEIMRLVQLHGSWVDGRADARRRAQYARESLAEKMVVVRSLEKAFALHETQGEEFSMTVQKQVYRERKTAGAALNSAAQKVTQIATAEKARTDRLVGEYRGFRLIVRAWGENTKFLDGAVAREIRMDFGEQMQLVANVSETDTGTVQSMDAVLRGLPKNLETEREKAAVLRRDIETLEEGLGKPWEYEERYSLLKKRLFFLDKKLSGDGVNMAVFGNTPELDGVGKDVEISQEMIEEFNLAGALTTRNDDAMIEIKDDGEASGFDWMERSLATQAVFDCVRSIHAEMPVEVEEEETPIPVDDFGGLFAAALSPSTVIEAAAVGEYREADLFAVMATEVFKEAAPRIPAHPLAPSIRVNPDGRLTKKKKKAMAGMNQISMF